MSKLNIRLLILLCLTLGLAPYRPEPHIIGSIRWIVGGANGMAWLDWADFAMHGLPWLLLIAALIARFRKKS
jgi:hypothetical protein